MCSPFESDSVGQSDASDWAASACCSPLLSKEVRVLWVLLPMYIAVCTPWPHAPTYEHVPMPWWVNCLWEVGV